LLHKPGKTAQLRDIQPQDEYNREGEELRGLEQFPAMIENAMEVGTW
jgi:hypothetical protein